MEQGNNFKFDPFLHHLELPEVANEVQRDDVILVCDAGGGTTVRATVI